jgi:uncharacterized protein
MASITVTATGTAPAPGQRAEVHLSVEATGASASEALASLAARLQRLRGVLAERGVDDQAVATQHLHVGPRHDRPGTSSAGSTVQVSVGALGEVPPLLEALVGVEGVGVGHVGQLPATDDAAEAAARRAAVEVARERAGQLADAAGGTVGGLLSLLEGGPPVPMHGRMQLAAATPEAHLWEQQSQVAVTVTAVYELVEG